MSDQAGELTPSPPALDTHNSQTPPSYYLATTTVHCSSLVRQTALPAPLPFCPPTTSHSALRPCPADAPSRLSRTPQTSSISRRAKYAGTSRLSRPGAPVPDRS